MFDFSPLFNRIKELECSIDKFASLAGITVDVIYRMKAGKNFSLTAIDKIMTYLEADKLSDIFTYIADDGNVVKCQPAAEADISELRYEQRVRDYEMELKKNERKRDTIINHRIDKIKPYALLQEKYENYLTGMEPFKEIVKKRKLSLVMISKVLDIPYEKLVRLNNGMRLSWEELLRVADMLDVKPEDLFTWERKPLDLKVDLPEPKKPRRPFNSKKDGE